MNNIRDLEGEMWENILGYEGLYQASNMGRIKSLLRQELTKHKSGTMVIRRRNEKILRLGEDKDGYLKVALCKFGKPRHFSVHQLVAKTFIPNPENLLEVNHKNGIKNQNNVENLEWSNHSLNMLHSYEHNLHKRENKQGEKHGMSILKNESVLEIRKLATTGLYSHRELARMFGVDKSTISYVIRRKLWRHI